MIHLAAIVGYPACHKSPQLAQAVNIEGARSLLRARLPHQTILFASTGSCYGAVEGICTEETPLSPLSEYGLTKAQAERDLWEAGNVVVYRFATAFGVSPRLRLDLLVNDFVYQALTVKSLVVNEGSARRTFIHVSDMARAFLFALVKRAAMRDRVYNVGSERMNLTKRAVAELIREKLDFDLTFADTGEDADKRDDEVSYSKSRDLSFQTRVWLSEGMDDLIATLSLLRRNEWVPRGEGQATAATG